MKKPAPWLVTDFSSQERPRAQGSKHQWSSSALFLRLGIGLVLIPGLLPVPLPSHLSPTHMTQFNLGRRSRSLLCQPCTQLFPHNPLRALPKGPPHPHSHSVASASLAMGAVPVSRPQLQKYPLKWPLMNSPVSTPFSDSTEPPKLDPHCCCSSDEAGP